MKKLAYIYTISLIHTHSTSLLNINHKRLIDQILAPNRGLGARRGLLKRVDFLETKSDQKKFRQGLALKR